MVELPSPASLVGFLEKTNSNLIMMEMQKYILHKLQQSVYNGQISPLHVIYFGIIFPVWSVYVFLFSHVHVWIGLLFSVCN